MFLTVHSAVGMIIGSQITNVWLAYFLGFCSHFVLDFIPHAEKQPKLIQGLIKFKPFMLTMGLIDGLAMTLVIATIYCQGHLHTNQWPSLIAMIGSVTPDFIAGLAMVTNNRWLLKFQDIHDKNQFLTHKSQLTLFIGIPAQIMLALFLWTIFLKLQ